MSASKSKYQLDQVVRLTSKATGAEWETAVITAISEFSEGSGSRFEYCAKVGDKLYQNVREEHIEPKFIISSIL